MLAVVKTPRTRKPELEIRGNIPKWMLTRLKKEYGNNLKIKNDEDDGFVNVFNTDWFKKTISESSPGENIKLYRENLRLTQTELGKMLGNIPRQNISSMEKNRRGISKEIAKKLSAIFDTPIERFL